MNCFNISFAILFAVLISPFVSPAANADQSLKGALDRTLVERIKAVAAKSKSVTTAAGYTEVVDECDALLAKEIEKPEHRKYLQTLIGWALDKRGAARVDVAARFRKAGSTDQADVVLDQAAADFDRSIANDETRWRTWMNRGALKAGRNLFEEAVADFDKVIELKPDSIDAFFNRGELNYQIAKFESALKDYERVLEFSPDDLAAVSGKAHCLLALERRDEAIAAYTAVVASSPDNAWAYANRADGWLATQQWQKAREDLEKSVAIEEIGENFRRLGWLLSTCPDESFCDGVAALKAANHAIRLDGETASTLDTLAAAFAAAGQFDRARDVQTRAIAMLDTEDPDAAVRQATYEKNERYQESFDR